MAEKEIELERKDEEMGKKGRGRRKKGDEEAGKEEEEWRKRGGRRDGKGGEGVRGA
jgi:hypothetical protein